jgi:hypothetical protein
VHWEYFAVATEKFTFSATASAVRGWGSGACEVLVVSVRTRSNERRAARSTLGNISRGDGTILSETPTWRTTSVPVDGGLGAEALSRIESWLAGQGSLIERELAATARAG